MGHIQLDYTCSFKNNSGNPPPDNIYDHLPKAYTDNRSLYLLISAKESIKLSNSIQ